MFALAVRVGPNLTDEELRHSIRERLADGRLFRAHSGSTVRRGTGRPCDVCGRAIEKASIEREAQGDKGTYVAHEDCFRIWREESRREQPPPAHV